jgi:hypothetical protein
MDNIHKDKFAGVDTSHLHRPVEGERKVINGTVYVYLENDGKLKLFPVRDMVREVIYAVRRQGTLSV